MAEKIRSVTTLDSPLDGEDRKPPFSPSSDECQFGDRSWRDIDGRDRLVLSSIASLIHRPELGRFMAINSSPIGDVIPGMAVVQNVNCAGTDNAAGWGLLGTIVGAIFSGGASFLGLLSGLIVGDQIDTWADGHGCVWYDQLALRKLTAIINGVARSAKLDDLSGIASTYVQYTDSVPDFNFTNTSDTAWTFSASFVTRRTNGQESEPIFVPVHARAGETVTAAIPLSWGEAGVRDIRVTIWEESSGSRVTRIADSGWLIDRVTVVSGSN
jgi:hypothetical protein